MKKLFFMLMSLLMALSFTSCKEQFSNGERVGTVVKFSKAGVVWDSYDGQLNLTQTGMNSAGVNFRFSFDNDRCDQDSLIHLVEDAQRYGWKIKLAYHQVWGFKNIFQNRGESDYFIDGIEIIDKNFANPLGRMAESISIESTKEFVLGSKENPIHIIIDKE